MVKPGARPSANRTVGHRQDRRAEWALPPSGLLRWRHLGRTMLAINESTGKVPHLMMPAARDWGMVATHLRGPEEIDQRIGGSLAGQRMLSRGRAEPPLQKKTGSIGATCRSGLRPATGPTRSHAPRVGTPSSPLCGRFLSQPSIGLHTHRLTVALSQRRVFWLGQKVDSCSATPTERSDRLDDSTSQRCTTYEQNKNFGKKFKYFCKQRFGRSDHQNHTNAFTKAAKLRIL